MNLTIFKGCDTFNKKELQDGFGCMIFFRIIYSLLRDFENKL